MRIGGGNAGNNLWGNKVRVHFIRTRPDNELKQGVCLNGKDDEGADKVQVCMDSFQERECVVIGWCRSLAEL